MPSPGEIVIINFVGALETKKRPALVVSTTLFHSVTNDMIVAILTSNIAGANRPTDYILQDWNLAGLRQPTAFRPFMRTEPIASILKLVGTLSPRDWKEVQDRMRLALAVT